MAIAKETIYLDNNSTTPCDPAVVDAMLPFFGSEFGNPSSQHILGRRAADAVERAREQVANLVGCTSSEIIFTGGATESSNLVILGVFLGVGYDRRLLTSTVEHMAILAPCEYVESRGNPVIKAPVNQAGVIDLEFLRHCITPAVALVSVQAANNEVGVVQPVAEVSELAKKIGALFHCDAAQALGKIPFDVRRLGVDFASFSAHKVYGPKGVGALYVRADLRNELRPVLFGGGQEGGLRPGTLSVPSIVGFGAACEIAGRVLDEEAARLGFLRDSMERDLLGMIPTAFVNGTGVPRLPGTSSITIPNVPADLMIANLPNVCVSNGSACTSGALSPSHVLLAMGLSRQEAECTLRISLGRQNDEKGVRQAVRLIVEAAARLRREIG